MKLRIRTKLILAICLPLVLVYLTMLALEYQTSREQAIAQMQRHLTEATARLASEIDKDLTAVRQTTLNTAALMTQYPLREEKEFDTLLRSNVRDTPTAFGAAIAFEPFAFQPKRQRWARYVCRAGGPSGFKTVDIDYDYGRWDWYLLPKLLGRPAWTDPYFDEGAGDILMCTCAAPFYRDEQFQGVVTMDIALGHLREKLSKVDARGGYCVIISRTGTFVSHPDESYILGQSIFSLAEWYQSPELADVGHAMTAGQRGVRRLIDAESGEPVWIVFAPIGSVGWSAAAVIPEAHVMADVYARVNRQALMLLGGLAAIVLVILAATGWMTRPIARLAVAAQELAKGNLEVQVPGATGRDEIAEFACTFNAMVRDLKNNIDQRIRETAARQSLERELQVARQIQTSLLPTARPPFPDRKEFSLDAGTEPAKIMAGDFFDFWFVDDDLLALVVADVCGKGVPAAMFMAVARTLLRSFSTAGRAAQDVLAEANRVMSAENREQMFVTMFYAHYDVRAGTLTFVNAGHNPPYIIRKEGAVVGLGPPTGPIVGVWEEAHFEEGRVCLAPGDALVAFTDGVTEAADAQGVLFGEQRLENLLSALRDEPVEEICRRIVEEVDQYRQGKDQDDVTVLVLRRRVPDS